MATEKAVPDLNFPAKLLGHWKSGRVADCACLENRKSARTRGFESYLFRFCSAKAEETTHLRASWGGIRVEPDVLLNKTGRDRRPGSMGKARREGILPLPILLRKSGRNDAPACVVGWDSS